MKHSNDLQKGEGIRMKKNLSKKQLGAVGLAAMMAVQTPAMAAEVTTSPEATVQETAQEQQEETVESVSFIMNAKGQNPSAFQI